MPTPLNKLPPEYLDLNEMSTASRSVSVLYGRRSDGSLVAIQVDNNGVLASSAVVTRDLITQSGSINSFYSDQTVTALTTAFVLQTFGFTSRSVTVINDSDSVIDFSFNGTNIHGKLKASESAVMDSRAQAGIYLKSTPAGASYRVWSY